MRTYLQGEYKCVFCPTSAAAPDSGRSISVSYLETNLSVRSDWHQVNWESLHKRYWEPTRSTVVIWDKHFQIELMVEIYLNNLVGAIGEV